MVYCVVPYCTSDSAREAINFHEFPSNALLRVKWLAAISREGETKGSMWIPSQRSSVCGKHFLEDDYKANFSRKLLKPGVIPSVFPQYPKYKKVQIKTKRRQIKKVKITSNDVKDVKNDLSDLELLADVSCIQVNTDSNQNRSENESSNVQPSQNQPRPDWIKFSSARVCGLHFAPEHYNTDLKIRKLKPESVPCIFPGYPQYSLPNASVIKRFDAFSKKSVIKSDKDNSDENDIVNNASENINRLYSIIKQAQIPETQCFIVNSETNIPKNVHVKTSSMSAIQPCSTTNITYCIDKNPFIEPNISSFDYLKNSSETSIPGISSNVESSIQNSHISSIQTQPNLTHLKDFAPHTDISSIQREPKDSESQTVEINHINNNDKTPLQENCVAAPEIKKYIENGRKVNFISKQLKTSLESEKVCKRKLSSAQRGIRRYKAKILKLQEENEKIQSMTKTIREKFKQYNIDQLEKGIENKDAKALFLHDQLRSFTKERILWSESTMEFASSLEEKFPASYSFLRQTNIISLPCSKILRYDLSEIDDADSDS